MNQTVRLGQSFEGIAFVGNYLPRVCGIATFTYDLAEAVAKGAGANQPVIVAAMNDNSDGYFYPNRVKFEIRQDYQIDYSRAADFLNFSRINVVSLQHEYGIFGGEWGANVLTLLRDLHRPVVVTCHTVLKQPEPVQKEVFQEIAARAHRLVVMSERAVQFLREIYGIEAEKIVLIPHGIHDVPFVDPNYYKDKFGVEGRKVLLTFGLLHRNKGIEYMIEALPAIVGRHPRVTYLILGATHPHVVRDEGEAYRLSLQRRARELGVEDHVLFHPRFVELDELLEYLGAADICVTPYLNLDQITSGALSYAMGAGKAVVSTPYWHAAELLADGRGRLVPVEDSKILSETVSALLDDEVELNATRKRAYTYCRRMIWPAVAQSYLELFNEVRTRTPKMVPTASALRRPIAPSNLPLPKLDHVARLIDDTGPAHHAVHTMPDWTYGYRLEDAAAVLVASAKFCDIFGEVEAARLSETSLGLMHVLIGDGASVAEGLDYTRRPLGPAPAASIGRAIWGLGYLVSYGISTLAAPANNLFNRLVPNAAVMAPPGIGCAVLGAENYLRRFPGASDVRRYLIQHAKTLQSFMSEPGWINRWESPDWPLAVQALIIAAGALNDDEMWRRSQEAMAEMRSVTSDGRVFLKLGSNPDEEELPVSAATFIEALGAAFFLKRSPEVLQPIRAAADWFLGRNRIGTPLYDFSTGGCHDALTASGLNHNQGTEATVFCLIAFLTLHQLAGMEATSKSST
ncbi:MAG: glycosyltransferase [Candidatus Latescibacteria bacterium]|nr:glycosyltransferase [Candidatus Latescibacterota bacterium]NIM22194.1 glycosyltransferase [Candidatus Latescibacterota bacterium]NIM66233.1 glycosyltransferase [Candidatus Latescibacterota bacterium]NIO02309.1 glycosyltransferase [Candidatus Latescibacterota bacterium]NIO29840.1 glycosyltransferase [Candidatus Latescibacterota bacterium]